MPRSRTLYNREASLFTTTVAQTGHCYRVTARSGIENTSYLAASAGARVAVSLWRQPPTRRLSRSTAGREMSHAAPAAFSLRTRMKGR